MKTILRNFFAALRMFKLVSLLNLLGLAVAFAAFTIIMMQVRYDRSFDRFHPKCDRIYRLELSSDGTKYNVLVGSKWAELLQNRFPQIELSALRMDYSALGRYMKLERNGRIEGYFENSEIIQPEFAEIFDFEMVDGRREALREPGQILIPESVAKRYWGDRSPVGESVVFTDERDTTVAVGGVYKDFPKNTLVKNVIYSSKHLDQVAKWDGWSFNYELFLVLPSSVDKADFEKQLLTTLHTSSDIPEWVKQYKSIRLAPLPGIFYSTDVEFDQNPKGSTAMTALLFSLGLLLLGIAAINFINFAISLAPLRIKSINTQKILGSPVSTLRLAMVAEAVGSSLIAFLIGLAIVHVASSTPLASLFSADITLGRNLVPIGLSLGIVLILGLLAGIYPALYSTRIPPALVLKGAFGLSLKGRNLRTVLIGFQYVISIGLIIAALFMSLQNNYLRGMKTGYDSQQVAMMELNHELTFKGRDLLVGKLKESPQVEQVAFSQFLFGTGQSQQNRIRFGGSEAIRLNVFPVSDGFLDVMNIRIADGRNFEQGDVNRNSTTCILNDAARKACKGIAPGDFLNNRDFVVGFIDNINFRPLQTPSSDPFCFTLYSNKNGWLPMPWVYVKINGDPYAVVDHIKKAVHSIDPTFPVSVIFYDDVFDFVYQKERKTTHIITLLSLLAVVVSLVGVFSIVMFETQYRRKEIGLRKIFGATTSEVLAMFNRKFVYIVLICFAVVVPLSYILVNEWLAAFAYRIPLYAWVFAVALAVVMLITLLTVTIQSYRAASENPARSVKSE